MRSRSCASWECVHGRNNTMLDGEVVAEVDAAAFMPYAWSKWDPEQLRLPQERRLSKANRPQMDAA